LLESAHRYPDDLWILVEAQSAICLISIPEPHWLPRSLFITSLLGGQNLAADPRQFAGQMEDHTGVHSGDKKLVRAKLSD